MALWVRIRWDNDLKYVVPNRYTKIIVITVITTAYNKNGSNITSVLCILQHFLKGRFITRSSRGTIWLHLSPHVTSLLKWKVLCNLHLEIKSSLWASYLPCCLPQWAARALFPSPTRSSPLVCTHCTVWWPSGHTWDCGAHHSRLTKMLSA